MEAEAEAAAAEVLRCVASGAAAHAVLSLPAGASAADARTRYKQARPERFCGVGLTTLQLARLLHPDKARTPLAEDAFKGTSHTGCVGVRARPERRSCRPLNLPATPLTPCQPSAPLSPRSAPPRAAPGASQAPRRGRRATRRAGRRRRSDLPLCRTKRFGPPRAAGARTAAARWRPRGRRRQAQVPPLQRLRTELCQAAAQRRRRAARASGLGRRRRCTWRRCQSPRRRVACGR